MDDNEIKECTPTINDCMIIVDACCRMLQSSIEFHTEAQKRQFELCDQMVSRLDTIIELCDKRTERIENAASKLAESAVSLSTACETNNNIVQHLGETYTAQINAREKSYATLMSAYQKMLHKYEEKEKEVERKNKELINILAELARKTTVTNNTYTE